MEDYQLRKDIDRFKYFLDTLEAELAKQGITTINFSEILNTIYDKSEVDLKFVTQDRFGFDQESAGKFNFAVISREVDGLVYEEMWYLINAYYDYTAERFVKIDNTNASFGIQCQASGSYPGEQQLGYIITGIYFWRNPSHSDTYFDNVTYDYTDWSDKNYIGAKRNSDNSWVEFGIDSGWNNNFMIDNFGGMTIGGAGFEIDGNGIYPYGRLTSSVYSINGVSYYLLGILDNAYHPTFGNDAVWGCDTNSKYSWFIGLKIPESSYLNKNTNNATFVVMYNDTSADANNPHVLDKTKWHIVFEVDKTGLTQPVIPSKTSDLTNDGDGTSTFVTQSDISDVPTNANLNSYLKKSTATGKTNYTIDQLLAEKANSSHNHAISDVTNLQTTLNGKAPLVHSHDADEVTYNDDNWYNDEIASSSNGHYYDSNNNDITDGVEVDLDTALDKIQTKVSGKAPLSHTHTTDDIRLAGTQYAITTMLNTMYSYYQAQSSASPSWSGDSQNHVYVRNIVWDSTRSEYRITEDITDNIGYGTILILNVASTNANHYGGHDLYSFYNNGVSMNVLGNADMELSDYSTVMLMYWQGGTTRSPMWIPIIKDTLLCLNIDSSMVI